MKKTFIVMLACLMVPALAMAEKMEKCEPSLYTAVSVGATAIDGGWTAESNLETDFGVMFRTGHALYLGFQFQKLNRTHKTASDGGDIDVDRRTSRTNFPVYLMYQYRFFGWHKSMGDQHLVSPYIGVKAGWNFIQDAFISESSTMSYSDELTNNWFATPLFGFDYRCAEYFTIGLVAECEISRRYRTSIAGDINGNWFKPRLGLVFRF